jgi:hypothetical protein
MQRYKNDMFSYLHVLHYYGIISWGGTYDNALSQLQKYQNIIIKVTSKED